MAILHPVECYRLEQFLSVETYQQLYISFDAFVKANERALARYQNEYDPKRRRRPLPQQADIVWGTRVMPILYDTLGRIQSSYLLRKQNLPDAIGRGSLASIQRGMVEFDWDWMTPEEMKEINDHFSVATAFSSAKSFTIEAFWGEGALTYLKHYDNGLEKTLFPLPSRIPRYRLNPNVRKEIGCNAPQNGIYLPDIPYAAAQFDFVKRDWVAKAYQGVQRSNWVNPDTGKMAYDWKKTETVETGWTLIERVEGEYIDVPPEGFFPKGIPEELYNWPSKEGAYRHQSNRFITAVTGEQSPHSGLWSTLQDGVSEYVQIEQHQPLPEWISKRDGISRTVRWTLIKRDDGGDCTIQS